MLRAVGDHHLHIPVQLHTAFSERHARRQDILPFQAAETLERLGESGDHAGHGDRVVADLVPLLEDVGPGERIGRPRPDDLVAGRIELSGRDRPVVDRPGAAFLGAPHSHESYAADAAHPRLDRADRHAGRHGSVDGIAALAQYLRADFSRSAILGHDHALATHGLFGDLLLSGQRLAHRAPYSFPGDSSGASFRHKP